MIYSEEEILNTFRDLVREKFGKSIDKISELQADSSERKIYRLFVGGKSFIGIGNEDEKENLAFINFTYTFIKSGLNVPDIINVSADNLFYIEEDLGDVTMFKLMASSDRETMFEYYKSALADLIRFQVGTKDSINYDYCYQTREFNSEVIESDVKKFNDYFSRKFLNETLNTRLINSILEVSNDIIIKAGNNFFLYRDFQPRNIMIMNNRLYYIDYQSGRKGPLQYDVASFLYSGSIDLNERERDTLLNFYITELNKFTEYDERKFKHYFYFFVFLRLVQMLGNYAYLYETRRDKIIPEKISKALNNLKSISDKIENGEIKEFIKKLTSSLK